MKYRFWAYERALGSRMAVFDNPSASCIRKDVEEILGPVLDRPYSVTQIYTYCILNFRTCMDRDLVVVSWNLYKNEEL